MIDRCLARPGPTLAVIALATVAFAAAAVGVKIDNTAPAWLPSQDDALAEYRAFREVFGEDAFLMLASEPLDLEDPAVRDELRALEGDLRALEGVDSVVGALGEGDRLDQARLDMPRQLDLLERARGRGPVAADLLELEAELSASYAFLFLDDEPAQARVYYERAGDRALDALARIEPALPAALTGLTSTAPPAELLLAAGERALPAAFWWAFARGAEARASGFAPSVLADLPRVDAVMDWVLQRDEAFFHGGPHLYFAVRHASLPRSLGGDPERSLPHFAALGRLSGRQALLPRVLYARLYAPGLAATRAGAGLEAILAAQRRAWDEFRLTLREVAAAPPSYDEGQSLANAVARQRARTMLADPEAFGMIPPRDAGPEHLDAPSAGVGWQGGPLARLLVSTDGERLAWVVTPRADLDAADRFALVERVAEAVRPHEGALGPFALAGPDVITHDLDVGSQTSFATLFPLVIAVMALVLYGSLGSARIVFVILLAAGLAAVWTVGLLSACGHTLNMIVVIVPAILAVVTTAYALHLVSRFLSLPTPSEGLDRAGRVALWSQAAALTVRPCLLTAVTTAIGLFSLVTSSIPPVRDLGLFGGLGVLVCFGLTFTVVPILLSLSGRVLPHPAHVRWWTSERIGAAVSELHAYAPWILAGALSLALVATLGVSALQVESHILRFFPPEHPLPRAFAEIEDGFPGLTPLELWLEGDPQAVLSAEVVEALDAFLEQAAREELVTHAISPLAGPPGRSLSARARADLLAAAEDAPGLERFVRRTDGRLDLRVTLTCRTESSDAHYHLVERLGRVLEGAFPDTVRARLTGAVPLLVRVQVLLVQTQLRSFAIALLLVTVVLALSFRSPTLVLVSLVPNVLPILWVLGLMGAAGIPLNTATVTVAGIALGLVIDDTIHFLHEFAHATGQAKDPLAAVRHTLSVVGRPVLTTSVAVAAGFGAFVLAPFRPTLYFGLLIAVTAIGALVCDLVVLPALLLVRAPKPKEAP